MGAEARTVAFVCAAEILGLAGFSLVPALLPQFIASWSLSNAEAGWLAGMMSAGYMAAVLPLVALTDRMPARTIFLASSALNALSCFGIAFSDRHASSADLAGNEAGAASLDRWDGRAEPCRRLTLDCVPLPWAVFLASMLVNALFSFATMLQMAQSSPWRCSRASSCRVTSPI